MFKDILLPLPTHPAPVTQAALRQALDAAARLGGHVTGLIDEHVIPPPIVYRRYGIEPDGGHAARQGEAREAALSEHARFEELAKAAGLSHEGRVVATPAGLTTDPVVAFARLRDLTVVPSAADGVAREELVQALVFETGRPVLLMPQDDGAAVSFDRIVVAWDFGRAAARALGDALPLLRKAASVRIVTVINDKAMPEGTTGKELIAHLSRNGVEAGFEQVERGGRSIGAALDAACSGADLLVMGAFGHSRIRDFFLGGATRHVLSNPRLPTLLSH